MAEPEHEHVNKMNARHFLREAEKRIAHDFSIQREGNRRALRAAYEVKKKNRELERRIAELERGNA